MSRLFLIFLLHIAIRPLLNGQSVTISDYVNIRNDNGYEILGRYKGNILLFRDKITESEIAAFDDQMRLRWQKTLEYEERRPQVLDVIGAKDYFSIVYRGRVKGSTLVKVARYDGSANFIDSITAINYGERFNSPTPSCVYSENKKKALIYHQDQNEKIEATVIDLDNMKVLWQQNISLENQIKYSPSKQVFINNEGNAYFIYEKEDNSTLFSEEPTIYQIYEFNNAGIKQFAINIDKYAIFDIDFTYDNLNHNLNALAVVADNNKSKITGTLSLFKLNHPTPSQYYNAISDESVAVITGKKIGTSKGLSDIRVQEIIARKDGGLVAILEEVKQLSRTMGGNMNRGFGMNEFVTSRVAIDYYYDSMIAVAINPDGKQQWEKVLAKKQFSQDDDGIFCSYGILKTPASLRLIFNDEIKTETTTSEYVLTGDGNMNRHSLFNTAQQEILLRFRDGLQIGAEEVIIPSETRSQLRLVRLRY
jgi:hypothetical protein